MTCRPSPTVREITGWLVGGLLLVAAGCASAPADAGGVQIRFEGDEDVRGDLLRRAADQELAAFAEQGHRPADLLDATLTMERVLRRDGFAHARVEFTFHPDDGPPERVVFRVSEGPRARLGEATFPGAARFTDEELAPLLRASGTSLLPGREPPFRLAAVEAGVGEAEDRYRRDGYHRARVGPARIRWDAGGTTADVEVPVVEGPRFTVATVEVHGVADPVLRRLVEAEVRAVGAPYHDRVPAELAARARRALLARGHAEARATAAGRVDDASATASIRVDVEAGPLHRVAAVRITGVDRTQEGFVRGLVNLQQGEPLRSTDLDAALDALYGTGVFRSARIDAAPFGDHPRPPGENASDVPTDLDVVLEELPARSVELEAGWGSYELARGGVRYRDRNLFGAARTLDLRLGASIRSAGAEGRLTDRYLLGDRNSLELGGGFSRREEPSFDRRTVDTDLTVSRDLGDGDSLRTGYVLGAEEARSLSARIAGAEDEGFVRTAGLQIRLGRDRRDDPAFPTEGFHGDVGLLWSSPSLGADLEFLETSARAAWHLSLSDRTVLALGGRFVTRDILDERTTLPIQERLFLGGESSVRSFRESELGPADADGDPLGGLTTAEAHVELRQRISQTFDGALFYDVGTVGSEAWEVGGPRGHALGVGLRYRLPVGPVRLDVAWNPGRRFAATRGWALHFSFGFSF